MGTENPDKTNVVIVENGCIDSIQANKFLTAQCNSWPLANENYKKLTSIKRRTFDMGRFIIILQYTPSRILSSDANVNFQEILNRQCFLCSKNLPEEQELLSFGEHYSILCNPYPIFPEHFTIPEKKHVPQRIINRFDDFLELAQKMDHHTLFYNGPQSGASAPNHAHFQAVTHGVMPLDREINMIVKDHAKTMIETFNARAFSITKYLRNGFLIQAKTKEEATLFFQHIYAILPMEEGVSEPGMNLFAFYVNQEWNVILIPRKKHRPWQFNAEGEKRILSSPGAADIGGLFIITREEDFHKMTADILKDIYGQVCYSDHEIDLISNKIIQKWKDKHK